MSPTLQTPTCPITGEPLLDPGQQVHRSAAQKLITQTQDLPELMGAVDDALAGLLGGTDSSGVHGQPASRPPLKVGLLDLVSPRQDTISNWAWQLTQHVNPNVRVNPTDWPRIRAIYRQFVMHALTWQHAPTMIADVLDAVSSLTDLIDIHPVKELNDSEKQYAAGALLDRALTIEPACAAVKLLTGTPLRPGTVRQWAHRGHITPVTVNPNRYLVGELVNLTTRL